MKKTILIIVFCMSIIACKQNPKSDTTTPVQKEEVQQPIKENSIVFGNYVDSDYENRNDGYDWVAVTIKPYKDGAISVAIRSRADKKEPTCSFDTKAFPVKENTYEAKFDGTRIVFAFTETQIKISTKNPEDENLLYFFCSGGASIANTFTKIDEALDVNQIDKTSFSKVLNLQNVGFTISSIVENDKNTLTIRTFGLTEVEYNETFDIEGELVIDAEVEDLNSDGSPELFVYTTSVGSGSYGNVYAFSVNNLKSMSSVYFPPTAENKAINSGYMGHDEFTLIENTLGQRFPIYKDGDSNANPTGGTRQISYKLVDGEASRKLIIDTISDYK